MRPRRATTLAAVVAALLVAACGSGGDDGPGARLRGDGRGDALDGRAFVSTEVTEAGAPKALVGDTRITLTFEGGRIGASAGCNSMSGTVDTSGGRLRVTALGGTEIGCDADRHAQDRWLAELLESDPTWRLDGDALTIDDGATSIVLADREVDDPDRPLEDTEWEVDTVYSGEVASSTPAGGAATLVFERGRVTGSTGCNDLGGDAVVEDGRIRFGPIEATHAGCPPPLDGLERAVLATLTGDVTYEIEAGRLVLRNTTGDGLGLHDTAS